LVEVKIIGPADRVLDRRYLMVIYGDHAMIVDADKGATRIVPLDGSPSPHGHDPAALLESAKRKAENEAIAVVYVIDHAQLPQQPGSPILVPD